MSQTALSSTTIWTLVAFTLACVISIIVGFNFALGTRRRLGLFFIWIPAALLIAAGSAAAILLTHR